MKAYEYQRNYDLEQRYWWFVGVRAIVAKLLQLAAGNGPLGKVLDVGCGTGALLDDIKDRCSELWGADISPEALEFCRRRGHERLVLADATKLDLPSGYFNVITAIGIIEHLDDDSAFLHEMHRLLAPGGSLVLLTSSFPYLWSIHDVANEHKRRYYLRDLERLTQAAGFAPLRVSHMNFLLFPALAPALIGHRLMVGLKSDAPRRLMPEPPSLLNKALTAVLRLESELIPHVSLPWGVSMVGAFRKAA